jgi:DNA-binding CsgD family transcriptional regulator
MEAADSGAGEAYGRGDWVAAFEAWSVAEPDTLTLDELDGLATAAEMLGHHHEAVAALQRAFARSRAEGDVAGAVRCAFRLSMTTSSHAEPALAAGWTRRAEEMAQDLAPDAVEHGWVAFLRMFRALGSGAYPEAGACADEVAALGRRHRDPDLAAMGICSQGRFALYTGRIPEGLALLDDAMVRVVSGELSPIPAGHVYCTAIEGAQEISDFGRVAEWTSALDRWCSAQPGLLTFTGQCALHRGQLMRLRGAWDAALEELDLACERYRLIGADDAIGFAESEVGDLLRLRGELDAADAAYQRAADHGVDPQPGLAMLWLARGRGRAARAAVDQLLAAPGGPVQRCRLLPAAIEVVLADGDPPAARVLVAELSALADAARCLVLQASAAQASGAVELADGDAGSALPHLRKADQLWARAGAPYERARTRVLTARALTLLDDHESAGRELEAARTTFRQVGAAPDADDASSLLAPAAAPAGLTAREVEVLRLVATGRSNPQIAADLVLSEKTVARHLSNIFAKLDVGSRTAATAFAYEQGLV